MDECVFCSRVEQPEILFETPSLYVMPDRFPLLPGHILIISKRHLRCHAERPSGAEEELDAAAGQVRSFLREVYGTPALAWENGVFGQTVFHAHLHLLPIPAERFPMELDEQREITRIESWHPVRQHFERHGGYRYMELENDRRLIIGGGPTLQAVRRWLIQVTGVQWDGRNWLRTTSPEDVAELTHRWSDWAGKRRAGD